LEDFVSILHSSPALVSVGIVLLSILITLQLLNWLRRIMMWWLRLLFRIAFWSVVVMVVSAVWQRGLEQTVQDISGWVEEVRGVWWSEYRRWEGVQRQTSSAGRGGYR
jgi:hypothetical protein